ncbi:hypothetical protein V6U90_11965 [Micromonospora sp. CPCC 206060]|uniref:hypothetical protein n=1 Tax=Micromonospora sp. CPCC 206060 TaxID=3122406 RepID=UPI002FF0B9BE
MNSDDATPDRSTGTDPAPAGTTRIPDTATGRRPDDTEPARLAVPDWMRQPEQEHPLTATERVRLGWEHHFGRTLGVVGGLLVLALLAGVGWIGYRVRQHFGTGPTAVAATPTAGPDGSPAPGSDAEHWARYRDRWAGTPAQTFPSGAAGIVLPPAHAVGPYTAAQVRDGLALVRRALVEARLGPRMLAGDNGPFLALMAPDARADLRKEFTNAVALNYATRIGGKTRWVRTETPRVKGTVTYRPTVDEYGVRVLEITTNFVWVYPFDVPATDPRDALVVMHDKVVWHVPHRNDVRTGSRGLWLWSATSYGYNVDCAAFRRGFLDVSPPLPPVVTGSTTTQTNPDVYYDPQHPLDSKDRC